MLWHAHVSKPMYRKVYWDLGGVCVKIDVLGGNKRYRVCACSKTCFGQICACNIGDPARTRSKKLFIDEEPLLVPSVSTKGLLV